MSQSLLYPYGGYGIWYKLQNSMEVDSVVIIAILSMSYINTGIVKS